MLDMDEVLLIEVEDRGPGISRENAERVFELGFSTKAKPNHGYGLHLVQQAVAELHGNITHTGNPSGGTIFTVTLPKKKLARRRHEGGRAALKSMAGSNIRVLIVEDDLRIAEVNRRFVEKVEGYEVVGIATNGQEARDQLELLQPDLVLLDIYFPDMDGLDFCR